MNGLLMTTMMMIMSRQHTTFVRQHISSSSSKLACSIVCTYFMHTAHTYWEVESQLELLLLRLWMIIMFMTVLLGCVGSFLFSIAKPGACKSDVEREREKQRLKRSSVQCTCVRMIRTNKQTNENIENEKCSYSSIVGANRNRIDTHIIYWCVVFVVVDYCYRHRCRCCYCCRCCCCCCCRVQCVNVNVWLIWSPKNEFNYKQMCASVCVHLNIQSS